MSIIAMSSSQIQCKSINKSFMLCIVQLRSVFKFIVQKNNNILAKFDRSMMSKVGYMAH